MPLVHRHRPPAQQEASIAAWEVAKLFHKIATTDQKSGRNERKTTPSLSASAPLTAGFCICVNVSMRLHFFSSFCFIFHSTFYSVCWSLPRKICWATVGHILWFWPSLRRHCTSAHWLFLNTLLFTYLQGAVGQRIVSVIPAPREYALFDQNNCNSVILKFNFRYLYSL